MSPGWTSFIVVATILIVPSTTITLVPNDPVMFEGDTLKMYCFLDESDNICNLSKVYFKFELNKGMKNIYTNMTQLKHYVHLNDTVAELIYPNVTVEEFNFSHVVCRFRLRNAENCTKSGSHTQRIKVKHLPTIDERSIRWYNMDQFKFSWTQDNSTTFPYQAFYKGPSDEEYKMCMANQTTGTEYGKVKLYTCRISLQVFDGLQDYNLKIIAENRTLSEIQVEPSNYIQAAVVDVTFDPDHTKINIRPSIETKMFYYRTVIICNNRVYMNRTLEDKHGYRWKEQYTFDVTALPPFTRCNLTVRCRIKRHCDELDIWSDEFSTKFETPQTVPSALPEICSGCFSSTVNSQTNSRSLILYFKRLADSELRGICKRYLVTYCKLNSSSVDSDAQQNISSCDQRTNESKIIPCNSTSAALNLAANTSYKVLVEAETEAGLNETIAIKPVAIPRQSRVIKNITVIRSIEKDRVYLNIKWLNDQGHNYTIFWCKSSDSIEKELNSSAPQPYRLLGNEILTIGISATNVVTGLGSGITWNRCIYDIDSVVPTPKYEVTSVTDTSIFVKIMDSDSCPTGNLQKYVYGYNINYAACKWESCNSTDWKKRSIYKDDNNKIKDIIIVDDLAPSTDYSFFLQSLTENEIINHEINTILLYSTSATDWKKRNKDDINKIKDIIILDDLAPSTDYSFFLQSLTENEIINHEQQLVTWPLQLSVTHWILIGFGVATAVILAIIAFATCIKQNVNRAREYLRIDIKLPQLQPITKRSDSSQPMLHDDQANFKTSGYQREFMITRDDYQDDATTSELPHFSTSEAPVYHQSIQSDPSIGQQKDDYTVTVVRLSDSWKGFREENGGWNAEMDAHESDGNILDSLDSYGSTPQITTQLLPLSPDSDGDSTYSEQVYHAHAELVFDYSSATLLNECGFSISLNVSNS